ncbi:hypothetical protein BVG16_16495 [Paenibacillus selenitireducens]|uniref:Nuclease SbcCD subunit C n=1 Tax=Paenibacillus selenitireducens TaxID=1324314 RepID=A0A1T2XAA2_9BACL|nr:ATP-binding protein [Paenibacillus selenitireducens]OPA76768.1 hypothetical protein BVG16_16495 [Paenibacillus selenitireducens]
MKKIILERLTLRNFKGFGEFTFDTRGVNTDAYGDNGTGKTTIFDAFIWLLFGKDSSNKADFEIKGLDAEGKVEQQGLEHGVEGFFIIDGQRRDLRRVFSEKWTKKRGSALSVFSGNTTDYYIDGVPVKAGEYKAEVDSVIKEDLFKLLTSPSFFNEQLKMEQRRKLLLEVCGEITDAEVIHGNKALVKLADILGDRSIENHKKVIAARRSEINKELVKIPVRIDEARRSVPDVSELDEELLEEDIQTIRAQIRNKEDEISRIQNGAEISVKEKGLREIETKQIEIKNKLQTVTLEKVSAKRAAVDQLHREIDQLRRSIEDKQHRVQQNERTIKARKQEADRYKADWTSVNSIEFEDHHDSNCPTCGQSLPAEQIKAAHDKAVADFNLRKSERLTEISAKGKAASEDIRQLEQANAQISVELEQQNETHEGLQQSVSSSESELNELRSGIQDPSANPEYKSLQQKAVGIQQEIGQLQSSSQTTVLAIRESISKLRIDCADLEASKARFDTSKAADKRISELEQQERELAAEFERLEQEQYLMEEFTRTKVAMLETKINSKFRFVRFRLFKEQINGGLEECCDTLSNGVPYGSGLNRAAEMNAGIDIINTLSKHYGFSAPIFIDNAEAVTKLIDTDAQVIRLIVPPTFDSLPAETKEELIKLHGSYEKASDVWKDKNKQLRVETKGKQHEEAI